MGEEMNTMETVATIPETASEGSSVGFLRGLAPALAKVSVGSILVGGVVLIYKKTIGRKKYATVKVDFTK